MESILDKLLALHYDREFCRPRNLTPLHRFYFSLPSSNPNEQFFYFASLVSWLLSLCGQTYESPGQFDDPNATAANLVSELKTAGIAFDFGPLKLKAGYGEVVLFALQALVDKAIVSKGLTFGKPVHKLDDYTEEAQVDAAAEVTTDSLGAIDDEIEVDPALDEFESLDDIPAGEETYLDAYQKKNMGGSKEAVVNRVEPIKPKMDPAEWKMEVERVTPLLKVQLNSDNRDWRVHLEQMQFHQKNVDAFQGETLSVLSRLLSDMDKSLEKITSREKYIQNQFEAPTANFKSIQGKMSEMKQGFQGAQSRVSELSMELLRVSEELERVKSRMDELGISMTDSKPLVHIKQAASQLKGEIKTMDLRIGVMENTLMQAKLKTKGHQQGHAAGSPLSPQSAFPGIFAA